MEIMETIRDQVENNSVLLYMKDVIENFDITALDLTKPEHRKLYKEARDKGLVK